LQSSLIAAPTTAIAAIFASRQQVTVTCVLVPMSTRNQLRQKMAEIAPMVRVCFLTTSACTLLFNNCLSCLHVPCRKGHYKSWWILSANASHLWLVVKCFGSQTTWPKTTGPSRFKA